ncbi:MAG: class I SAM-dependent methyltransferase [Bacteroidales bacterium]|nr:class I SAM-dependent methyltransferase [Bacteroidales bacterium]
MTLSCPLSTDELKATADCATMPPAKVALALKSSPTLRPAIVATQVDCRKRLQKKLPSWVENKEVFFPSALAAEQCSSESIARWRASLVNSRRHLDLSGGLGVDCYYISSKDKCPTVYVERNEELCKAATWNFSRLGADNIEVVCSTAEEYLAQCEPDSFDTIFIDPSRRSDTGRRVYGLSDCSPDVTILAPQMLSVAKRVFIKLSSMLDIDAVIKTLPKVDRVHIVGTDGECKDLLVCLNRDMTGDETVIGASIVTDTDHRDITFSRSLEREASCESPANFNFDIDIKSAVEKGLYLLDPHPVVTKAGCFSILAKDLNMHPVSRATHLFLFDSEREIPTSRITIGTNSTPGDFGRMMKVLDVVPFSRKTVAEITKTCKAASIVVKNYSLTADEFRKKYKIKESDETFIYIFTDSQSRPMMLLARRVN